MKHFLLSIFLTATLALHAQGAQTTEKAFFRTWITGRENIICTLKPGTLLEIIDMGMSYGKWTVVRYKGKVGFVETKKIRNSG